MIPDQLEGRLRRPLPRAMRGVSDVDLPTVVTTLREKRQEVGSLVRELDELHEWLHVQHEDVERLHGQVVDLIDGGAEPEEVHAVVLAVRAATDQFDAGQRQHTELRQKMHVLVRELRSSYGWLITQS